VIYKYIKDGALKLTSLDRLNYRIKTRLKLANAPLVKNSIHLKELYFTTLIKPDVITIKDLENEIYAEKKQNSIYATIDNMDFDINYRKIKKDYLLLAGDDKNSTAKKGEDNTTEALSANVLITNSTINLDSFKIKSDYLQVLHDKNETQISLSYKNMDSHAFIKNKIISAVVKNMSGEYLNDLVNTKLFKKGSVDIFAHGSFDEISATARIKQLKIVDNDWLNVIKNGIINVKLIDNILVIEQMVLDSPGLSLHGDGFIDFNKNIMEVALYTSFQNLIEYMGVTDKIDKKTFKNNDKLGFMIYIDGDVDDPNVKIHKFILGDILDIAI
jgi:hypothetical protein